MGESSQLKKQNIKPDLFELSHIFLVFLFFDHGLLELRKKNDFEKYYMIVFPVKAIVKAITFFNPRVLTKSPRLLTNLKMFSLIKLA